MQKYFYYINITLAIIFLCSCNTTKQLTSNRKKSEVNRLLILPPITEISIINKGNNLEKSFTFSKEAAKEITNQVKNIIPDSIKFSQLITDTAQFQEIFKSVSGIIKIVEQRRTIKGIIIPAILLHLLDSTNQDFCLGIWEIGFTRTTDNYVKQYQKSRIVQVATLGGLNYVPNKSYSIMICFIIDRKNKNLAFYRKSRWRERDPIEKMVIRSQLHDLIMRYFQSAR